jgi:hypothetical protein
MPAPVFATRANAVPVTPAGLVVVHDGVRFVIAIRPGDGRHYVAERTPAGLAARYVFTLRRAALDCRKELMAMETRTQGGVPR